MHRFVAMIRLAYESERTQNGQSGDAFQAELQQREEHDQTVEDVPSFFEVELWAEGDEPEEGFDGEREFDRQRAAVPDAENVQPLDGLYGNRFHVTVFNRAGALLSEFECPHVKVRLSLYFAGCDFMASCLVLERKLIDIKQGFIHHSR
jgi:hypothetical protein